MGGFFCLNALGGEFLPGPGNGELKVVLNKTYFLAILFKFIYENINT